MSQHLRIASFSHLPISAKMVGYFVRISLWLVRRSKVVQNASQTRPNFILNSKCPCPKLVPNLFQTRPECIPSWAPRLPGNLFVHSEWSAGGWHINHNEFQQLDWDHLKWKEKFAPLKSVYRTHFQLLQLRGFLIVCGEGS